MHRVASGCHVILWSRISIFKLKQAATLNSTMKHINHTLLTPSNNANTHTHTEQLWYTDMEYHVQCIKWNCCSDTIISVAAVFYS